MGRGEDPFKNPKDIGRAAWARIGEGFDDASAYQQIKIALMPGETRMTKILIEHKETIMDQYGKYLFEEEDTETRRKRRKMIINGLDMGSSETAWVKTFGNPYGRSVRNVRIRLPGGTKFSLVEYKKEQQLIAEQMALDAPAAMELVRRASKSKTIEPRKAKLTWQSYVLQEAEAAARYHKIERCEMHGKEVLSLQYDGIIVDKRGGTHGREAAAEMSRYVRKAVGYQVRVKHEELMVEDDTDDEEGSEWDLPPLSGPVGGD